MILRNGESTRDLRHGKYDGPMAVYLSALLDDGDRGDAEASDGMGNGAVAFGRRVVAWDDRGFVESHDYPRAIDAQRAVEECERGWHEVTCEECGGSFQFYDYGDACDACADAANGPLVGTIVNYAGCAAVVRRQYADGRAVVVLVGDDAERWVDAERMVELPEGTYCAECGQIGCTADGR